MPFTIETDASGVGMGAVLSQKGHLIAFFSNSFTSKLLGALAYVRGLCAITTAVKKWRQYLLGHHFVIITDHRSLKELLTRVIQTPEQHMYLTRLLGYDYEIQYRSGSHNQAVDALSRLPESESFLSMILSVPSLIFLEELRHQLEDNPEYRTLRHSLRENPQQHPNSPSFRIWCFTLVEFGYQGISQLLLYCLLNTIPLRQGATPKSLKPWHAYQKTFIGQVCVKILKGLWQTVWIARLLSMKLRRWRGCYVPCRCLAVRGRTCH